MRMSLVSGLPLTKLCNDCGAIFESLNFLMYIMLLVFDPVVALEAWRAGHLIFQSS